MTGKYDCPILDDDPDAAAAPLAATVKRKRGFALVASQRPPRPLVCRKCGVPITQKHKRRGYICKPCGAKLSFGTPEAKRANNERYRAKQRLKRGLPPSKTGKIQNAVSALEQSPPDIDGALAILKGPGR